VSTACVHSVNNVCSQDEELCMYPVGIVTNVQFQKFAKD
jgi:hypothetical protein